MSSVVKFRPHNTVADYQQWEGDWELWDGVAVATGPSPFGPHAALLSRVAFAFELALRESNVRDHVVLMELDWIVDEHTVVCPELCVVAGNVPAGHLTCPPVLIVEILSEATREKDRAAKFELYQRQGVRYYLLADPDAKQLEVFALQGVRYRMVDASPRYSFALSETCSIQVDWEVLTSGQF